MDKAKIICAGVLFGALSVVAAGPRIVDSTVEISQDPGTRRVTVNYSLSGEPGIVTFSVMTNSVQAGWMDVGGSAVSCVYGDVNRVVTNVATQSSFVWIPDDTWPDKLITDGTLRGVVTVWPTNDPPDYAVIEPRLKGGISYYANKESVPGGVTNSMYRRGKFLMRRIRATGKRFTMGSPLDESGTVTYKETAHLVAFTNDFYMGVFEVTQDQARLSGVSWDEYFYFTNLPYSAELPLTGIDYNEIRGISKGAKWSSLVSPTEGHQVDSDSFLGRLRTRTGVEFDIPTEAEWEFACRAGTVGPTYAGGIHNNETLDKIAWFAANSRTDDVEIAYPTSSGESLSTLPRPVGLKEPNPWGLYDMIGNVAEWCLDYADPSMDGKSVVAPMGPAASYSGTKRMTRGGSHLSTASGARAAARIDTTAASHKVWNGFRLTCPCPPTAKW